jgi:CubicO group peptidase (beta-lactamase class C family)
MSFCRLNYLFNILLISVLLVSCSQKSKEKKVKVKLTSSYFVEMPAPKKSWMKKARYVSDTFFCRYLANPEFNGQFLVAKNSKIIYSKTRGYSNLEKRILLTDSTPIHVASISKTATALAIMRLCDQNKIDLNQKVRHYLKLFPFPSIRVRDLLTHRSGLPHYHYFVDHYTNRSWYLSNQDVLKLMIKHKIPLNFKPNSKFAYCNTNFMMLALIVEQVTGKKFPKAMKELVFEPLDMKHTFILYKESMFHKISQSYNYNKQNRKFTHLDLIYGDKNMYTTVKDLFRLSKGTYSPKFISYAARKAMFKGYSYEKNGLKNYGLGVRIIEEPGTSDLFYHTGWWHGNLGMFAMNRKDTVCAIAISNVYNHKTQKMKWLIDGLKGLK